MTAAQTKKHSEEECERPWECEQHCIKTLNETEKRAKVTEGAKALNMADSSKTLRDAPSPLATEKKKVTLHLTREARYTISGELTKEEYEDLLEQVESENYCMEGADWAYSLGKDISDEEPHDWTDEGYLESDWDE